MGPEQDKKVELPKQEAGDKIIHHSQLHAPTLQESIRLPSSVTKQIINSQFELLQLIEQYPNVRLHDERNGAFTVVLEDKKQAKHVFVYPPEQVQEIRNAFPKNEIPKKFGKLSPEQLNVLYQHSGSWKSR